MLSWRCRLPGTEQRTDCLESRSYTQRGEAGRDLDISSVPLNNLRSAGQVHSSSLSEKEGVNSLWSGFQMFGAGGLSWQYLGCRDGAPYLNPPIWKSAGCSCQRRSRADGPAPSSGASWAVAWWGSALSPGGVTTCQPRGYHRLHACSLPVANVKYSLNDFSDPLAYAAGVNFTASSLRLSYQEMPQLLLIAGTSPELPDARLGLITLQELVRLSARNVQISQVNHLPYSFNYLSILIHIYNSLAACRLK